MTAATTGYITITRDEYGSDTLYISNIRDYTKSRQALKWNMNGLGYSKDYGKTFGLAITMDGSIVADYITTGVLNADVIRAGTLKDYGGNFSLDFESGKPTMKKGSIDIGDGNFTVDEEGNLTARRGTFVRVLWLRRKEPSAVRWSVWTETLRAWFRPLTSLTERATA